MVHQINTMGTHFDPYMRKITPPRPMTGIVKDRLHSSLWVLIQNPNPTTSSARKLSFTNRNSLGTQPNNEPYNAAAAIRLIFSKSAASPERKETVRRLKLKTASGSGGAESRKQLSNKRRSGRRLTMVKKLIHLMTKALVLLPILLLPNNGGPRPAHTGSWTDEICAARRPTGDERDSGGATCLSLSLSQGWIDSRAFGWRRRQRRQLRSARGQRRADDDEGMERMTRGPGASVAHRGAGFTEV
uniref:Uncharacterized protein n=1 Tax=Oryza meridionalis TaxID=40149 RepID=A0A0E0EZM2_9ORYZ